MSDAEILEQLYQKASSGEKPFIPEHIERAVDTLITHIEKNRLVAQLKKTLFLA